MICPGCQTPLPDDARFCCSCGGSVTAYEAPDGFEIDRESLQYYRDDGVSEDGTERYYTWFDPDAGTYGQGSRPVERPRETVTEPEFTFAPAEEPKAEIPEGFTLDPASGLYYLATPGRDSVTGAAGEWYTWYYPDSGEYRQEFYPSGPAPEGGQNHGGEPRRGVAERPRREASPKRKTNPFLIALPLIALVGGSAFAFIQAGGLDRFVTPELPEGIVTETLAGEDLTSDTPAGEETSESGGEGEDPMGGEDGDSPSEGEDDPGEEADRGAEPERTSEDGAMTVEADGVETTMNRVFRAGEPVVVQLRGVTGEMTGDWALMAVYKAGAASSDIERWTYLKNGSEAYDMLGYDPGDYELRVFRSEDFHDEAALLMTLPFTVTGERGEEPAGNWAALYADYLADQDFDYREFRFYGDMATFPVYTSGETSLAVMLATFYDVEGFDSPVMELLSMVEMEGEPGTLDTSPYSFLHIIRDGEVTRELTTRENERIVSYDDNTGMSSIRGGLIITYELHAAATGAEGSAMVDENFAYLYDWLAYEAESAGPARAEPGEGAMEAATEAPMEGE